MFLTLPLPHPCAYINCVIATCGAGTAGTPDIEYRPDGVVGTMYVGAFGVGVYWAIGAEVYWAMGAGVYGMNGGGDD